MKHLITLFACTMMILATKAQNAGDYVYTDKGRFKITTGKNLLSNGDFSNGTEGWKTDLDEPLSSEYFGIEQEDGNSYLTVYKKYNGPGTYSSLVHSVSVQPNKQYIVSYQVKGDSEDIATTVTSAANAKNYQNIFFNHDNSLTPAEDGAIAKPQTYGFDWTNIYYSYKPASEGYIVFYFYAPYVNTCFDNFSVMEAVEVIDDRAANRVISKLKSYIDNPLFPNNKEIIQYLINAIQSCIENDDFYTYNDLLYGMDEYINEFLDSNSANLTQYVKNGNFDDLATTGANQRKAGAWTIDDATPAGGKTRWSIKSAIDKGAPFEGNYLSDDVPGPYYLAEATVHQTLKDMPAGDYMFTIKARAGFQNKNNVFQDFTVNGLKIFINNDSTECTPIDHAVPDTYTVYSKLSETGDLKLGFYVPDNACNHIDFDVKDLRIIGWNVDMAEEYFLGKELAEARKALKTSIDSARVLHDDVLMLYGKDALLAAITSASDDYANITETSGLTESRTRLNEQISAYISENSALTALRTAIAYAESLLSDNSYTEEDKKTLSNALETAKVYLASLSAENHEEEGFTNDDIKKQTSALNNAANILLVSKIKADEKYEFVIWAQQEGAEYTSTLLTGDENAITNSSNSVVYLETAPFADHSLNNRLAFIEDLQLSLNQSHGLNVYLASKNKTTMSILNLKQGDQIVMDWTLANSNHNIMIVSANAKVLLANNSWQEYTKIGKDNSNILHKDNTNGLSGSTRSIIQMTADGTLDFYQSSSASALRIKYLDITYAENVVDGISEIASDNNVGMTGDIYDLSGRKLTTIPKSGIYIRNGKKVFVK